MTPIGRIHSPYERADGTPIQSVYAADIEGSVVLDAKFESALQDIEGFERIWLIYVLDRADPFTPLVVPYRDTNPHGLFATRSPSRPNAVGMSAVRLISVEKNVLRVLGIDVFDGTPLIDIKPYVPEFDAHPGSSAGWFDRCTAKRTVADDRFHTDQTQKETAK
jgi:tRNA-Thr(GGU) m(6)t(6)A37 methyltransferase TsaA